MEAEAEVVPVEALMVVLALPSSLAVRLGTEEEAL